MSKTSKVALAILLFASLAAGAALVMASRADIGASTVASEIAGAARQYLGADLSISSIYGNPLRGFVISNLSISKDGKPIFSSMQASVTFRLLSLITGSPQIKTLSLGGADLDWRKISPLISFEQTGEPLSLPFDRFEVQKSIVRTVAGDFRIEEARIIPGDSDITMSGSLFFRETPFSLRGSMQLEKERLLLKDLNIRLAGGNISLSGRLTPVVDMAGKIQDLDLEIVEKFWPDLAKQGYSGTFSTTFTAKGLLPDVDIEGKLEIPEGKVYGIDLNKVSSPWTFSDNALQITDLQGSANGTPVSGKLLFAFSSMPPVTTIDLRAGKTDISAWRGSFPWLSIAGGVIDSVEIRLQGLSNALSGPVTLRSSSLTLAKQPLSNVRASMNLEKGSQVAVNLGGVWLGSQITGKGKIDLTKTPSFDLTFSGKDLDLSKAAGIIPVKNLDLSGKSSGSVRIFGTGQDVQSEGTLWSELIRAAGESIEKPDIRFAYQKGTITLRSLAARWRGTRIAGSGTISGLTGDKGVFDLSGNVDETPISSLAGFVPALGEFKPEGKASANWSLKGPVKSPMLALEIFSSRLSIPGLAKLNGLKVLTKVALPPASGMPDMRLDMAAESLQFTDFSIDSLRTALSVSAGKITIENGQGKIFGANLAISGSVGLPAGDKPANLDLKGTMSGIDLSALGKTSPVSLKGPVETQVSLKGDLPDPQIALSGKSSFLLLAGLNLADLTFKAQGSPSRITIEELKGSAGKGTFAAKGTFSMLSGGIDMDFSIDGKGLELEKLTKELQGNGAMDFSGAFDATLAGSLKKGKWNGKGELLSNRLTAYGLVFTNASIPLLLQEEKILAQNSKADFYGGSVTADGSIEIPSKKWNIRGSVSKADIAPAVQAAFPLDGKISGKGDLDITLSGAFGKHLLVTGRGNLVASNGELSGFKALNAIAKTYGLSSIRYRLADVSFKIDGNVITLLPGSRATAHPDDPLYRYFSADGPAGPGGSLNLFCSGLVNVQALNTLLGAIQGLAGAGSASPQALLEGLIGGFVGGMGSQDFRDVSFRVGGTWNNPSMSSFKISSPSSSMQTVPETGGAGQTQNSNQQKVTISVPTGEGADKPSDAEGQIKQQVIEQILRNVIPGSE